MNTNTKAGLRALLATIFAATIMFVIVVGTIDLVSWYSNTSGIFYKHKPEFKVGECAVLDASNEFKTKYIVVQVKKVGAKDYLLDHFFLVVTYKKGKPEKAFKSSYESADGIEYFDKHYQKIDCDQVNGALILDYKGNHDENGNEL